VVHRPEVVDRLRRHVVDRADFRSGVAFCGVVLQHSSHRQPRAGSFVVFKLDWFLVHSRIRLLILGRVRAGTAVSHSSKQMSPDGFETTFPSSSAAALVRDEMDEA
jgi:hypothetical protein